MAKLYPPNIKGVIPAFYGATLVVPFSMNKAVGEKEISGFEVKIKTISGIVKLTQRTESLADVNFEDLEITFTLPKEITFEVGQFYKIQIAYLDERNQIPGYYSTVGIAKYTAEPEVYIESLDKDTANTHIYNYVGVYTQKGANSLVKDASEKLYSSRFVVWDENYNIYKDTGDVVHNTTKDINTYEASEEFSMLEDLEDEKIFYIQFSILTVNLLRKKSPIYRIKQRKSITSEEKVFIAAENDFVNGCINLHMYGNGQESVNGYFVVTRASNKTNFLEWEEVFNFKIPHSIRPEAWKAKDFSGEQGVYYKYGIQQYNDNGVYSEKNVSEVVYSDFEDAFLYDGKNLLNIRFNPKVSSFKIDLQENKQETIGSQFPYIFRNGHINYKEFPISGLVSYLSDVDGLFFDKDKLFLEVETTNLISENMAAERDFKLKVLSWLNDGMPKIFKSPAEGNYIVRLMNTSMSPTDSVSRMLHTFSSTAYEIMEYNSKNLLEWSLVGPMNIPDPIRAIRTVSLNELNQEEKDEDGFVTIVSTGTKSISFTDLLPCTIVKIDDDEFVIGSTGSLYFDGGESSVIKKVSIKTPDGDVSGLTGAVTYTYSQNDNGLFDLITGLKTEEIPLLQFFGNFYNQETLVDNNGVDYNSDNILDFLQDARTDITKLYMIRFVKRDHEDLYIKPEDEKILMGKGIPNIKFYTDKNYEKEIDESYFTSNKFYPIKIGYSEDLQERNHFRYEGYYIDAIDEDLCPYTDYAIDGLAKDIFIMDENLYKAIIDDVNINIMETDNYTCPAPQGVENIEIGRGITAEISFTKMTKSYIMEETNAKLKKLKRNYLSLLENSLILDADYKYYLTTDKETFYLEYKNSSDNNGGKIESSEALRKAYYDYLSELSKQLQEYKEANSIL